MIIKVFHDKFRQCIVTSSTRQGSLMSDTSRGGSGAGRHHSTYHEQRTKMTAEELAAEAMAADMDRWITYVPSAETSLQEPFEDWLANNRPSQLSRSDGVGWICVRAPGYMNDVDDEDDEDDDDEEEEDGPEVHNAWEALRASGRTINLQTITELAKTYEITEGKWLFYTSTGLKVDHLWSLVAHGVVSGQCGTSAKVSPVDPYSKESKHVVCIYNSDFTDQAERMELENSIRNLGIKCMLLYKPDIYTTLGVYRNNEWGLHPTINKSVFDLLKMRSIITDNSNYMDFGSSKQNCAHVPEAMESI